MIDPYITNFGLFAVIFILFLLVGKNFPHSDKSGKLRNLESSFGPNTYAPTYYIFLENADGSLKKYRCTKTIYERHQTRIGSDVTLKFSNFVLVNKVVFH